MFDYIFSIGVIGAIILVTGSAWPSSKKAPYKDVKNWLLAIGTVFMLAYSLLGYLYQDIPIFFTFLQGLVIVASIFMMLDFLSDKLETVIISLAGMGLIIWSLMLFESYNTIIFVFGLIGIALGYSFTMNTIRRYIAFILGSIFIAIFSYIEQNWIFFWLNIFFAIFSAYYLSQKLKLPKPTPLPKT